MDEHATQMSGWRVLRCLIHVHTAYDGGGLPVQDVIALAARHADALLLNDHRRAYAAEDGWDGWHGQLFVLTGTELATRHDHLLVYGARERIDTRRMKTSDAIRLLKQAGATVFVAHPQGLHRFVPLGRRRSFTEWESVDYDGVEIWNYMHDWIEDISLCRLPDMCRCPQKHISGPLPSILRQWDAAAGTRRVAAIGGLDNHGRCLPCGADHIFRWAKGGILPYEQTFRDFATYVLVGNTERGEGLIGDSIIDALRCGRSWMSHEALANARPFTCYAQAQGKQTPLGGELTYGSGVVMHVQTPVAGRIRLLCQGRCVADHTGTILEHTLQEPGAYRVEVSLADRLWIVTNHIYVK